MFSELDVVNMLAEMKPDGTVTVLSKLINRYASIDLFSYLKSYFNVNNTLSKDFERLFEINLHHANERLL